MENRNIRYYEEIDSTNEELHRLALDGEEHGTVVSAKRQTAGKGRRGREWESSEEDNIYMSVLLRPKFATNQAPMLTLVMAYSVARVLEQYGFDRVQIKWPNDLILSGKKVCGILTEMHLREMEIDHVIVGVGINVNQKNFPEELVDKATSLFLECGKPVKKEKMVSEITDTFMKLYERFAEIGDLSFLQEAYNQRLVNREKEVRVLEPDHAYTAYALGIDPFGELMVRLQDGTTKTVYAGEVSVRGVYGYI